MQTKPVICKIHSYDISDKLQVPVIVLKAMTNLF